MPLYEFECDACGHRFERIQKLSAPPPDKCPKCGRSVHKVPSAPAFQFRGSGWYVTDYARKDSGQSAKSDGGSSDASKESKDKKTAKAETKASSDKPAAEKSTPSSKS